MDLVIGIGNRLRRDDGIGPALVESLGRRPGVEHHAVYQLTPDLVSRVGEADRVLFVDAAIDGHELRLDRLAPSEARGLGHALMPGAVLHLAARLYGVAPPAWLLSVPGRDFEIGEELSPEATARLPEAMRRLEAWLEAGCVSQLELDEEEA